MTGPHPPSYAVRSAVERALIEDLEPLGDLTSAVLPEGARGRAELVARGEGVVAGCMCVGESFAQIDPDVRVTWRLDDGNEVAPGDVLGSVEGPMDSILSGERTALNFLCHLSGIATLTRRYVRATHGRVRILDTRKTTPGLRALERAAVRAGGGVNHRGSLSGGILIKDNHLAVMTVEDAVRRSRMRWPGRLVEVECDSLEQVRDAVEAGAEMVLLDNMSPAMVRTCVEEIAGAALVEVSGGISLANIGDYADAGADLVSVGALTHSAPILDIGLDTKPMRLKAPSPPTDPDAAGN
ncbi:MAG TPA: carboxylating nicotinate-nucleotide diphosphorylase [Acidimicrobiales bacterium]|nr:carboxylating nicotinate-nucleotide diphosphorylase [Acidimicrobiales bacterium]